jgi:methylmalonyl-CoA/ethylmalonyl-CoA epimerase
MDLVFHHIGIACSNLAREKAHYQILGYRQEGPDFRDPLQKVDGCFMTGPAPRIELLAPVGADSPLHPYLASGIKMYHQCFETRSIEPAVEELKARGARVVAAPKPAIAFGGRRVAFLMLPNMMLVELMESESPEGRVGATEVSIAG